MNTAQIKAYAPRARRDFIQAVTEKANLFGLSEKNIEPAEIKGDVAIIAGRPFSKNVGELQRKLAERIQKNGFDQVMEAAAYTWFNRFAALRYMEIHDYLGHGLRVLSNRGNSSVPEILEHAADVDFQGMDKDKVIELRLAGNKDNDLYRLLIVAQCNALHDAMPFLFEKIDNETELLLPDNLLHSDSTIRKMVTEINEEDWSDVEIIGWIYQFYISERKNEVIGKVVKSEDIPAATQLFTPNWIVKYMVQNTLGRMWLATYPDSPLKDKMEYYIEPAEQEPGVQEQLDAITPKELNPEEITFLDPASGSGHILVEAYNVLKQIYLERGYRTRDIPRLILEKNLYGLDIDDRAAQLACFAVLMKARKDDRRILSHSGIKLNIMAIQETSSFDTEALTKNLLKEKVIRFTGENELFPDFKGQMALRAVKRYEVSRDDVIELIELFHHGKTFGSLITIPESLAEKLPLFARLIEDKLQNGDIFERTAASKFKPVVEMAMILARKYDCVVTNPPYMGSKGMNPKLKALAKNRFPASKSDLFAMFIERGLDMIVEHGYNAMVTMQSWMFLSSYEKLRERLLKEYTITCMVHMANMVMRIAFGTAATVWHNLKQPEFRGNFSYVYYEDLTEEDKPKQFPMQNDRLATASAADFKKIPGRPIAYWVSGRILKLFDDIKLNNYLFSEGPCKTGNDEKYLRIFWEVDTTEIGPAAKWCFCSKGGDFRKFYGNIEYVIKWDSDSRNHYSKDRISRITAEHVWEREGVTWSIISAKDGYSFRLLPSHAQFNSVSPTLFVKNNLDYGIRFYISFLNSKFAYRLLSILNPTLALNVGNVLSLPIKGIRKADKGSFEFLFQLPKKDWDFYETSWNFTVLSFLQPDHHKPSLKATYAKLCTHWQNMTLEMQRLEEENNRIFIEAYGLQDELTPEVPLSEITLTCNPHYRYGGNKNEKELEALLLDDTIKELISYAVGCMMGRYSLNQPGLIYAHSGNINFGPSKYKTFPSDDDGIIPIMDMDWFDDDATNRFIEFLKVAWTPETLDENFKFIADSLKPKNNEAPIDTIRRYMSTGFFKDHLKTYKKRPIYWLFSSGKQKAFECLVYLHRYNESTLSRMRSAYVTPLQGKFNTRLDYLRTEKDALDTASAKKKIQKEIDVLKKNQAELSAFDIEMRHYADMKILLDLDDGVKVNYGKFGNLLAEKKAVTGKK